MPAPGFLLYNASAGSAAKHSAASLLEVLRESGSEVELHEFREGDDPRELVESAIARGAKWIAVAGGDGTIEAAAAALIGTDIPLGIIPCGTFNNFARSVGIPLDPPEACRIAATGRVRAIDVGFVNGEPFFECVGVGLDAELFPVSEEIKSGGVLRWLEFFRRAYRYRRSHFEIEFDRPAGDALMSADPKQHHRRRHLRKLAGRSLRIRALLVTVSNGPYYGANFAIAPHERMDDGLFTVGVFKRFNKLALWRHFLSISFGRRAYSPELLSFRCAAVSIRGDKPLPAHRDGTPVEQWPLHIELRQAALKIRTSAG